MRSFSLTYLSYIASPAWRERRRRALERADYRCQLCGERRSLQVHHVTYANLGSERDADLTVLCALCHIIATWTIRIRRALRRLGVKC